jgi:hypothetical protein
MFLEEKECKLHLVCAWQDTFLLIRLDQMQDHIISLEEYYLVSEGIAQYLLEFPCF